MTVKITHIFRKVEDTKFGAKDKVGIKTEEHGDRWLTSFRTRGTEDWKEGDEVDIDVVEKGDFLDFIPKGFGKATASTPDKASIDGLKEVLNNIYEVLCDIREELRKDG